MFDLSEPFRRFIEQSPVTVMLRGILERTLHPQRLDEWFARTAQRQYTRELLFSTVFGLMLQVVCGVRKALNGAYRAAVEEIPVSIQAVYNKINGLEPQTAAELVRYTGGEARALIEEMGGARPALLPGYRVKILDGNWLAATEHRLKELRGVGAAALPGKTLVVYDPGLDVAVDVFPCEDGHAQERSLLGEVLERVAAGEVWVADRNFCVRKFLRGLEQRGAFFVVREHEQVPWKPLGAMQEAGETATGTVAEQAIEVHDEEGQAVVWRRLRVRLKKPTRDGDDTLYVWTNLPAQIDACTLADLYRNRWTVETAFGQLERNLCSEINSLGYPKAALFGFCVALVAYNTLAVLHAALRCVHGVERVEQEVSSYHIAEEVSATYRGMMIAIPPADWLVFRHCSTAQMAQWLLHLAEQVRLAAFRKHRRGAKKPQPKRSYDRKHPHVSTAKLLAGRCA